VFRKRQKLPFCMPVAFVNERQLKNFTVIIPTDYNLEAFYWSNLFKISGDQQCFTQRAGCPRNWTNDESSTVILAKIVVGPQLSMREYVSEAVLPKSCVQWIMLHYLFHLYKIHFVQELHEMIQISEFNFVSGLKHKESMQTISCLVMRPVST